MLQFAPYHTQILHYKLITVYTKSSNHCTRTVYNELSWESIILYINMFFAEMFAVLLIGL